ncbi:PLP-dependent aminotransferase family protein [Planktotalea lamellibrachiae]|nr:PLP-dependent aminotransferase family protein [Aliiroseovarius lamellibrachiae]
MASIQTHIPALAFTIDRHSKVPVFEQICTVIRTRAVSGSLTQGTRLPATRAMATELGVSRSTIVTAYDQLVAEGYLTSVQGSGYTVCAIGEVELAQKTPLPTPSKTQGDTPPTPHPFQAGRPDMRLFPHAQWAKTTARICRTDPRSMLEGASPFGHFKLRQAIAAHVADWRGITASPHQIIITAGSTDALEICTRSLAQEGDRIGLENPGYLPLRHFAEVQGLDPMYLDATGAGADLPPPGTAPRLVVLTPSHQYPLGGAMSPNRRLEFIHWAQSHDAWIIEDDYDSEFRYAGRPIPAMAGFDHLDRTLYIGSFSKIFSSALRLGYVIVPDPLIDGFRDTMRRFGQKASLMPQAPLAEFISSGEFYRHLRRVRRIYGERRKFLLDSLAQGFAEFGHFEDHQAGMQVTFHLNEGLADHAVSARAADLGVTAHPLSEYATKNSNFNGLVLGFCGFTPDEMAPALGVLRQALRAG